jgi:hypothetical protein
LLERRFKVERVERVEKVDKGKEGYGELRGVKNVKKG